MNNAINITAQDISGWLSRFFSSQANFTQRADLITAERAMSVLAPEALDLVSTDVLEQVHRRLHNYTREEAARALNDINDLMGAGSQARTPHSTVYCVSNLMEQNAFLYDACRLFGDSIAPHELVDHIRALKMPAENGELTDAHNKLENAARAIESSHPQEWHWEPDHAEGEGALIGARCEDDSLNSIIRTDVWNYTGDPADDEALAEFIALARPANVAALFDLIRAQAKEIEGLRASYAMGVRDELERLAPRGKPTHHPNSNLPIEGLKQEIRDLFAQVTGDYDPTESDKQMLQSGLDNLFLPDLPIDDYAAARASLECTIAWLENGNDPKQAATELRHNLSRLSPVANLNAMPGYAFWVTQEDSLNELSPAEVLLGKALFPENLESSQQRMLAYAPGVRFDKVIALIRMYNAERRARAAAKLRAEQEKTTA